MEYTEAFKGSNKGFIHKKKRKILEYTGEDKENKPGGVTIFKPSIIFP
jgi:hypothetical protein